jgi:hypothetical protein
MEEYDGRIIEARFGSNNIHNLPIIRIGGG